MVPVRITSSRALPWARGLTLPRPQNGELFSTPVRCIVIFSSSSGNGTVSFDEHFSRFSMYFKRAAVSDEMAGQTDPSGPRKTCPPDHPRAPGRALQSKNGLRHAGQHGTDLSVRLSAPWTTITPGAMRTADPAITRRTRQDGQRDSQQVTDFITHGRWLTGGCGVVLASRALEAAWAEQSLIDDDHAALAAAEVRIPAQGLVDGTPRVFGQNCLAEAQSHRQRD